MPYSLNFASVNNFVPDKLGNLEDSSKMHSGTTEDLLVCRVLSQSFIHKTEKKCRDGRALQTVMDSSSSLSHVSLSIRKYFRKKTKKTFARD